MTTSDSKSFRKVPLRLILIVPFVVEVVGAVGLTGWLAIQNGQKAVNDLATQLENEVATRVEQHLESYLAVPKQINQNNVEAIRLGLLDIQNQEQLERTFWQQTQVFKDTSYISFGKEQNGGFVDAGRLSDGTVVIEATPGFVAGDLSTYGTDQSANRTADVLFTTPDYDPRTRPWYTLAVDRGQATWTEVFSFVPDPVLGITAAVPVYTETRQLQGVLAVDLTLSGINQFLQSFQIGQSGEVFIIERSGLLIGTSTDQLPFLEGKNGEESERLNAADSNVPLIQSATLSLLNQFGDLKNIRQRQHFAFNFEGQKQFVQVVPFQDDMGLDWLIVVTVPESDFMAQINANTRDTILLCVGALGTAIILGIITSRWITQPILRLTRASEAIAKGELEQSVNVKGIHELNVLGESFNQMAQQLRDFFNQLSETNAQLEQRVEERTAELSSTLTDLQRTQAQLVQTEKMSSLGQLVAGVAHEINNPVNFIHGNLAYASEYTRTLLQIIERYQQQYPHPTPELQEELEENDFEFLKSDFPKLIDSMNVGAHRIREIVKSLRNFSRLDEAEFKAVDIHEGIDSSLMILNNRLKDTPDHPGVQVMRDYGALPLVECYPGQLNQVFMNLLTNAIDALDEYNKRRTVEEIKAKPNRIDIYTEFHQPNWIKIRIADNGPGISEEIRSRLFDPFFTTKPIGKGTGLGLSISYQIVVEKHDGKLECFSTMGQGTEFSITIPVHQKVKVEVKDSHL